ncbi:MAG: hypothetical protein FJW35_14485, partial [Acidobacteria bacterium]|nr:hypothetical protein [Acidobacteriota bacterium]
MLATAAWAQLPQPTLTVDGNPVITARPVARIGDEWFLPLLPIARALGVDVAVSAEQQELRAKRPDGMEVHYNGRTGEIRSGHALVGRIQAYQQVQIIAPDDDLLFPLSGVVALLGAAIQ